MDCETRLAIFRMLNEYAVMQGLDLRDKHNNIFTLAQNYGVAIEVEWYEQNEAFVITIRKDTFKDCVTISAEKLDNMRDEIGYVKSAIRHSAMAVNRAYEKEQDMYADAP